LELALPAYLSINSSVLPSQHNNEECLGNAATEQTKGLDVKKSCSEEPLNGKTEFMTTFFLTIHTLFLKNNTVV